MRVRLVSFPLDAAARQGRFGHARPCPGHEGLRGPDTGEWAGRTLDEVAGRDPAAVRAWLSDPAYAPPGGESVDALIARVGAELTALPEGTHRLEVEQAVVRAAVVHALHLPAAAFWRLDVRPESVTTLTGRSGRWNLLVGQPQDEQPHVAP
ncbi:histidine phosphatase family protein [Streptomyces sp. NPDC016734]|uniref:histidine phosphatase family protein n=1 Tax=Streptomyces sp. NPDC016734 TaxID=3364971 RepID=UPI00378A4F75